MSKNYELITCKVAIYTSDGSKVLVVEYVNNEGYGLPGGHLERGEEPIKACVREVQEELGVILPATGLILKDSWRHTNGKIILGYISLLSDDVLMDAVDANEISAIQWVNIQEIEDESVPVGTYKQFILDNAKIADHSA
ncbi:NUDIX hydrolase [Candidatus Saccharibacteria bacterium]|nr:NUDIX hydrolase [Candidatus Saccharibacteria bacterium]